MQTYLIVGGVAAGATAAARLRRLDEEARIILLERGPYVSYANCGLPYYIGGEIQNRNALFVSDKETIEGRYRVEVWDNTEVIDLDASAHTVQVQGKGKAAETVKYDKLLLATGSSPFLPPITGANASRVFSLWTVADVDRIKSYIEERKPQKAVVVGGGFIGLEMVENLVRLGLQVEVVEMLTQLMAPYDPDMAKLIEHELVCQGVKLHLGKGLHAIEQDGQEVLLDDGSRIQTDLVILSLGVRPNNLLAQKAGLKLNERGYVITDAYMRTSDPDIYAAGDLIEVSDPLTGDRKAVPLAGPANKQGRLAADTMLADSKVENPVQDRIELAYPGSLGTCIARIFDLSCASTGLNEKTLQKQGQRFGQDYAYSLIHPKSHAGYFPAALPLTLKLIFSLKNGRVLGAQIIGYDGVDKRIDVISTALHFKATVYDLAQLELAYAPPYGSAKDPVNFAGFTACNILEGLSSPLPWDQAIAEFEAGQAQILDVREEVEFALHKIEGAKNIPLPQLRDRLGELDKSKKYNVHCAVGLRGYIAERILRNLGFDAHNILGGLTTWEALQTPEPPATDCGPQVTDNVGQKINPSSSGQARGEQESASTTTPTEFVHVDACGLSCPGPIVEISKAMAQLPAHGRLRVTATDPGFVRDIDAWVENTGNILLDKGKEGSAWYAELEKTDGDSSQEAGKASCPSSTGSKEKTMIVFSGDLDKAIASFIIANGAAAMGNKVNMFFTFWGLNVLRRPEKISVKKNFMGKMFSSMLPRGSKKLGLSQMNFGGAGAKMIRSVMKQNNVSSLEDLIEQAREAGVKFTACQMSMELMGITKEELIDGVEVGGVAAMLNDNDRSNMNLFI
ncbi:MAG: FAD-dependent oxidoreductase [Eubacteriales bacterium]|nr:FAD-dependent oxidoreductase [Eubacteriales bacterium]